MLSRVHTAHVTGLKAETIDVEIDVSRGLHAFSIVGLGDKAVDQAKDRIKAAIKNSGIELPTQSSRKIVVSLAPADQKKEGASFDLAIALAFLLAMEVIDFDTKKKLFVGELSLGGEVRPIRGVLLLAQHAKKHGFRELYVPKENAAEAALVRGIDVYPVETLMDAVSHLDTAKDRETVSIAKAPHALPENIRDAHALDFQDVTGQEAAKRGLEIAAAGGHNVAMYGPPGTGKTMLAKAFAGILPALSFEEALEATGIHSVAGLLENALLTHPPLRAPHHTSSYVSIVGGGATPRPGEITLAHKGVLFMDEFPEFDRRVIEALRQPLEERIVSVSRAKGSSRFPAHFILVATMNPCPCGNKGHKTKECICPMTAITKYERKLSGPIMDRIDLWLEVPEIDHARLKEGGKESSDIIRKRVEKAREKQAERFDEEKIKTNAEMGVKELKKYAPLGAQVEKLLETAATRMSLSPRAYHRVIKLARTIADLDAAEKIKEEHMLEALTFRPKSR